MSALDIRSGESNEDRLERLRKAYMVLRGVGPEARAIDREIARLARIVDGLEQDDEELQPPLEALVGASRQEAPAVPEMVVRVNPNRPGQVRDAGSPGSEINGEPRGMEFTEVDDDDDDDEGFTIDFSDLPDEPEGALLGVGPEVELGVLPGVSIPSAAADPEVVEAERKVRYLDEVLRSFGDDPIAKANDLLRRNLVELVAQTESTRTYNVAGSRLYVTKVLLGGDQPYAECSCPNGSARGGDSTCYHSIAARVAALGLADAWLALGRLYP